MVSDNEVSTLTTKQKAWLAHYLKCWNATEAARKAKYANPNKAGPRLLGDPKIKFEVERALDELAMPAREVLARLSQHARSDLGDFLDVDAEGVTISLKQARVAGITHLIKEYTQDDGYDREGFPERTVKLKLYDAQAALKLLAQHHGLLKSVTEVEVSVVEMPAVVRVNVPAEDGE